MKNIKRLTASILAAVSVTAMAASMAPAFAYEDAETFVNSFEEGIDRECAQYLIDNGFTLDEAKDAMDIYMEGLAMMESNSMARATSNNYYYSTTNLAPTDHFALVIAGTPAYTATKVNIDITANSNILTSSDNRFVYPKFAANVNSIANDYISENSMWNHNAILKGIKASSESKACAAIRYPIVPTNGINSEAAVRNNLSFEFNTISNYEFALETYAIGDVDHNGIVSKTDSTLLLQCLAQQTALDITYADGSNHYSFVTNLAAADFNLDGSVSMSDLVELNRYLG